MMTDVLPWYSGIDCKSSHTLLNACVGGVRRAQVQVVPAVVTPTVGFVQRQNSRAAAFASLRYSSADSLTNESNGSPRK